MALGNPVILGNPVALETSERWEHLEIHSTGIPEHWVIRSPLAW